MKILVTNDDGIEAEGILALAQALAGTPHTIQVVAPAREFSGAGASIGDLQGSGGARYAPHRLPGLEAVEAFAVEGAPALCVWLACLEAFGPAPSVVCSGINAGANCGRSVLHSGTVGAALTAANFGCSGLAVSLDVWRNAPHWDAAAEFAVRALDWLTETPAGTVLNLNVPEQPPGSEIEVHSAPLATIGTVYTTLENDGVGQIGLHQRSAKGKAEPGSDAATLIAGAASLTRLTGLGQEAAEDAARFLNRRP